MRRREFLTAMIGSAALWPLVEVSAEQNSKVYRIAVFVSVNNPAMRSAYRAFVHELRTLGFIEEQNLIIEQRPTDQAPAALAADVAELVRAKTDAIITSTRPPLQAAANTGIPIVILANNYDPIAHGHVRSLSEPGGNVTGIVLRQTELAEKQVELLTQAFPDRKRLAVQWDSISADQFSAAERRAKALGLQVISIKFESVPYNFAAAFQRMKETEAQMLLNLSSPFMGRHAQEIVDLTIRHRLPTMFIFRSYAELGGLMSYGADPVAIFRQIAVYVSKVLRGTNPANLPVEQPRSFELAVNLKTAKALGIELPTSILLRADTVIE
jgi:putative ABC transport system substrate-binding protein